MTTSHDPDTLPYISDQPPPPPARPDWFDQEAHQDPDVLEAGRSAGADWAALEAAGAPAPEPWGVLDLGGGGGGGRATEARTGTVAQVARDGGGLLLIGHEGWLNVSRFGTVTQAHLLELRPGDEVELGLSLSTTTGRS